MNRQHLQATDSDKAFMGCGCVAAAIGAAVGLALVGTIIWGIITLVTWVTR